MASFSVHNAPQADVNTHCEGFEEMTTNTVRQAPSQCTQPPCADNATSQISNCQYSTCPPSRFPSQEATAVRCMPFPPSYMSVKPQAPYTTAHFPQSQFEGPHHILPNTTTQFCQPQFQSLHNPSQSNMHLPFVQSAFAQSNYSPSEVSFAPSLSMSTASNACQSMAAHYNPPTNMVTYFEQPQSLFHQNTTAYNNQQPYTTTYSPSSDLTLPGFQNPNPSWYSAVPCPTSYMTPSLPFQPTAVRQYPSHMMRFASQPSMAMNFQSANMRSPFSVPVNTTERFPLSSKITSPNQHPAFDPKLYVGTHYFQHSGMAGHPSSFFVPYPSEQQQQQHFTQSPTTVNAQPCGAQYRSLPFPVSRQPDRPAVSSFPMQSAMPVPSNQWCMGHYTPLLNAAQEKISYQQPDNPSQSCHNAAPPPNPLASVNGPFGDLTGTHDPTIRHSFPSNMTADHPQCDMTSSQARIPSHGERSYPTPLSEANIPRPSDPLPLGGISTPSDARVPLSRRNIPLPSDLAPLHIPPIPIRHHTSSDRLWHSLSYAPSDLVPQSPSHPPISHPFISNTSPSNPLRLSRPDTPYYNSEDDLHGHDPDLDSEEDTESDDESPFALMRLMGSHARRRRRAEREDHNRGLSDDDALVEGIAASLSQEETTRSEDRAKSSTAASAALVKHLSACLECNTSRIKVNRDDVWNCSLAFFKDVTVSDKGKELMVRFEDSNGKREEAVDDGGPKREYLQLLLEAIVHDSGMLQDDRHQGLSIRPNISLHFKQHFRILGIMLATIIAQCGRPPAIFASPVVDAILDDDPVTSLKYIPSTEIRESLQMVCNADTAEALESALSGCEWRYDLDGVPARITLDNKEEFVTMCVHYYVHLKSRPMLDQMVDGLRHCGILKLIRAHKLRHLLEYDRDATLTAKMVMNLLVPTRVLKNLLVPTGVLKNLEGKTQEVAANLQQFLTAVENGNLCDELLQYYSLNQVQVSFIHALTLGKVLTFVIGCSQEPVGGFSPSPSIVFREEGTWRLPHVSTCSNELHIYVHEEAMKPSSLAMALVTSLMNSETFNMA